LICDYEFVLHNGLDIEVYTAAAAAAAAAATTKTTLTG